MRFRLPVLLFSLLGTLGLSSCNDNDDNGMMMDSNTITIENVVDGKSLVQSGTFKGSGTPPVIFPGQSVSISFYAGKGQSISFATMYGWSNDLFFAPVNPGIKLYNDSGTPVTGDVSSQVKLWDNGTRINQIPGSNATHPGTAESSPKNVMEVIGTDMQGNSYLPASELVKADLAYNGNAKFTLTLTNNSGGTANETPLSPGVWAVSYVLGSNLLNPEPLYSAGKPSANGLTNIAEMGDNLALSQYLTGITGLNTPLSPVLVVVYNGNENPFYKTGENDRGQGLKELSQQGNADILAAFLRTKPGIKEVYVLKEPSSGVLLAKMNGQNGGKVSQKLSAKSGDRIAVATMYGLSNDWFFATKDNGIDAGTKGDVSSSINLYDNGTAMDLFPGANGIPAIVESKPIQLVANPNSYTTLPAINQMIKVTLQ
jgi:hypothetical protein